MCRKNGIFEDIFFGSKDAVGSDNKDAFSNPEVIDLTSRRRAIGKRRLDFSSKSVQPKNTTGVPASLTSEVFKFNSKHPVQNNIKAATIVTESTVASNKVGLKADEEEVDPTISLKDPKVNSKISPVVDPKEICWYCHAHRNDLAVLFKCEGCNPKVI